MYKKLLIAAAVLCTLAAHATAETVTIGNLKIDSPTLRATAPGANVGAGYLSITNMGTATERLTGGDASFAGKVEIHEMKMENQVMRMKHLADGLEIPAGKTAILAPGGNHVMFMQLKEPLMEGENQPVSLIFENAGKIDLNFEVKSIAATMKMKN